MVCVYVYMYGCQRRVSDSFEVELQAVVSLLMKESNLGPLEMAVFASSFSHSGSLCFFLYSPDPMLSQALPDTSGKELGRNCLAQFFSNLPTVFPAVGLWQGP